MINPLFIFLTAAGNFDQPAGGDGRCGGIFPVRLCRLPEIHQDQSAVRNVGQEIVGYAFCRIQILLFAGMYEA